ncbi:hypothetical protein SLA2020_448160 [Shorea laevis]
MNTMNKSHLQEIRWGNDAKLQHAPPTISFSAFFLKKSEGSLGTAASLKKEEESFIAAASSRESNITLRCFRQPCQSGSQCNNWYANTTSHFRGV